MRRSAAGIIFDLRCALYAHLQRMSLRFYTTNKSGELVSRLNNDVVGAQNAVTNTLVDVITNVISVSATLAVMLALEWRLTLLGMAVAAGIPVAGQTVLESVARDVAQADGAQCAPRRDHERNPQHQRHAAGEAVRAAPRGTGPVRRSGGGGARWQRASGGGGQPLLHLHGGGHGGGHRGDLPGRRPPGDSGSADHRHGGGVQCLSQPVVRPAALAEQRAG